MRVENGKAHIQKGKKEILRVVFSRTGIILVLLMLQFAMLLLPAVYINNYSTYYYVSYIILAAILGIYIINGKGNPTGKLAWMLPFIVLPVFGIFLYLFVKLQFKPRWMNNRLKQLTQSTLQFSTQKPEVMGELAQEDPYVARLAEYVGTHANYPVYKNSEVKYFPLGEDKFAEMKRQLEKARYFIFLEYFIVEEGEMWGAILEILKRKVKDGVEVRFMYDGMCSLSLLPYRYPKKMIAEGIQCKMFAPIRPMLSTQQNNRDHRKILVIDGQVAFTGGINLADEYINKRIRFGHWKDTAIMIKGEAVKSFTLMFLKMWNVEKRVALSNKEDYEKYLNIQIEKTPVLGAGYIIPYADNPLDEENVGENVYLDMLYTAKKYVHIMTPYLILDYQFIVALTYAAKRGIDVSIIMPGIPDKQYAFAVAKTYYKELIEAGVKIYEYIPGFMHAKSFVSDDDKAVVGTINLDYRSFYHHFECAAYIYKNKEIEKIEADFQNCLRKCRRIEASEYREQNILFRIMGRVLRIFAPLM